MWDMQEPELSPFDKALLDANKIEATNISELNERERDITSIKVRNYHKDPIGGNFDYTHLKAIHERLFGDIYTFAGKDRYELGLKDQPFQRKGIDQRENIVFTHGSDIPAGAKELFDSLQKKNLLKDLPLNSFARQSAEFFGKLNTLHPFREGNGRTQRLFMESLAKNAGYDLSLDKIPGDKMNQACQESHKQQSTARLEMLFRQNLKPLNISKETKITL